MGMVAGIACKIFLVCPFNNLHNKALVQMIDAGEVAVG